MLSGFLLGTGWQLRSVRAERDRAQTAEQNATASEKKTQDLLAQSSADAGRLAMQRGRFRDALSHFDQSLQRGYRDVARLRLWRIEAMIASRQVDLANHEMELLIGPNTSEESASSTSGNRQGGALTLWQAELALEGLVAYGDAEMLFSRALDRKLSDADRTYAQGMLAETTPGAIEEFRAAIGADPIHHRARRMLIALLITMGRFDGALTEIETAQQLFPDDNDFRLWEALVQSANGDLDTAERLTTAASLSADDAASWTALCRAVHFITHEMEASIEGSTLDQKALAEFCTTFTENYAPLLARRGFHFPPQIATRFQDLPAALDALAAGRRTDAEPPIARLVQVHPASSFSVLLGELRLARKDIAGALPAFEAAEQQSALVKNAHLYARKGIVGSSLHLGMVQGKNREANLAIFAAAAQQIPTIAVARADFCRALTIGTLQTENLSLARKWAKRWIEVSEANPFDALWHLMIVEQRANNHMEVIRLCDEMLKLDADHSNPGSVDGARTGAIEAIREQVGENVGEPDGEIADLSPTE